MRIRNKLLTAGCIAASIAALLTGLSCNDHEIAPFSKSLAAGAKQSISSGSTRQVDILFVVDNSTSMREEQAGLDENFNLFLEQLINANADFRLGVVSTSFFTSTSGYFNSILQTEAYDKNVNNQFSEQLSEASKGTANASEIEAKCKEFFSTQYDYSSSKSESEKQAPWIYSGNKVFDQIKSIENKEERSKQLQEKIRDLFRCQFMLGIGGDSVERGLINTVSVLENTDFKRKDSLLAIVFVTDENDCSNMAYFNESVGDIRSDASIESGITHKCETYRNIEDSCTLTSDDYIDVGEGDTASSLVTSAGQLLTINGRSDIPSKTLRQWCVQGDKEAQEVLAACLTAYTNDPSSCAVGRYINCPNNECNKAGALTHRADFFDRIVNEVATRNAYFYGSQNAAYAELAKDVSKLDDELRTTLHTSGSAEALKSKRAEIAKKVEPFREFAKEDIIVASIINRDRGLRYDSVLPEQWCGEYGTQSYRYQLFAEMFENDPIYAPICCMGDEPYYSVTESRGEVCVPSAEPGSLSEFGPVLGAIGRRIGEAVNTMCAEAAPITCDPDECDKGSVSCPCNHGCNRSKVYMDNTENKYYLCNEFEVKIGNIPHLVSSATDEDIEAAFKDYREFTSGKDFEVDYESNYCLSRTGSPLQIIMNVNEAGRDLIIEYPKKVSGSM